MFRQFSAIMKGQYAAITMAFGIGSETMYTKNDTKETMDPNSKNNRAAS